MSYFLPYHFGNGELHDVQISGGAIQDLNSYARVSAINSNTVTISPDSIVESRFGTFKAGDIVLLHVSASNSLDSSKLGVYLFAKITLINGDVFTFDKNIFDVDLNFFYVQMVSVPQFDCLKIDDDAVLTPPVFNPFNFTGGILAFFCFNDFILNGHIDLTDCGIPANRKNSLRPLTEQESASNGLSDNAKFSGLENFITSEKFLLNAGDGAFFVAAKNFSANAHSRIGNPSSHGMACSRAAFDSFLKPSNVSNVGGSSIIIAADSLKNFSPNLISKYRNSNSPAGKGLARCFIASNSILPNDEALYSFDILHNPARVRDLGVHNFGNASFGDCLNPSRPLNNFAKVFHISQNGKTLFFHHLTCNGVSTFTVDSLVLIHSVSSGFFKIAKILQLDSNFIVVDSRADFADDLQIVSVPQFRNLTISSNYHFTPAFDGEVGGVFAVAVDGVLDLSNGKINLEGKGGAHSLNIGNSQAFNRLPLGGGAGSAFILARKIILNENSRIGCLHSGAGESSRFGGSNESGSNQGGGYTGAPDEDFSGSGGGYHFGGSFGGLGGSGFSKGTSQPGAFHFDNVAVDGDYLDGASIFIIAGEFDNFQLSAISTGGKGSGNSKNGAAGFGGGGSASGSGGNSGSAFIFLKMQK